MNSKYTLMPILPVSDVGATFPPENSLREAAFSRLFSLENNPVRGLDDIQAFKKGGKIKKSKTSIKQKQKQTTKININIDNSKRTTKRAPNKSTQKTAAPPTFNNTFSSSSMDAVNLLDTKIKELERSYRLGGNQPQSESRLLNEQKPIVQQQEAKQPEAQPAQPAPAQPQREAARPNIDMLNPIVLQPIKGIDNNASLPKQDLDPNINLNDIKIDNEPPPAEVVEAVAEEKREAQAERPAQAAEQEEIPGERALTPDEKKYFSVDKNLINYHLDEPFKDIKGNNRFVRYRVTNGKLVIRLVDNEKTIAKDEKRLSNMGPESQNKIFSEIDNFVKEETKKNKAIAETPKKTTKGKRM